MEEKRIFFHYHENVDLAVQITKQMFLCLFNYKITGGAE
jgi:hypothetical protein